MSGISAFLARFHSNTSDEYHPSEYGHQVTYHNLKCLSWRVYGPYKTKTTQEDDLS